MNKLVCALVLLGAVVSGTARAAGTHVDVLSGRATAMAAAVTADVNDPSAVFFNPADIIRGEGVLDLQIGDTLIIPSNRITLLGDGTVFGTTPVIPPFTAYATYGITRDFSAGLGVFEPFGLKVAWPQDWVGQQIIRKATLNVFYLNPELAYRIGPLQVGAGVQVVRATVDLKRGINFVGSVGQVELAAGAWGVGGNAGVMVEVVPDFLSFGATYRSRVKLDFDNGTAHFTNVPPEFAGPGPGELHDQTVSTSLTLPDIVGLGISVKPFKGLHINADADYFSWQLFRSLNIHFEDPTLDQVEPKRWNHTWNFHLGGEYEVTPNVAVRLGAMWDPSPQPTDFLAPDIPDVDRVNLAAGVGFHSGGFTADLGYQHLLFINTTSTFSQLPGRYGGFVNIVSLSLGYRFGCR